MCTVTLTNEFSAKGLQKSTLIDFIKRLKQTGSISRKSGSGRPRTAQTTANIDAVDELVLSQEDECAFLSQSVVLYCEFVEHPPGPTPVRQQRLCWRSFALFLTCRF